MSRQSQWITTLVVAFAVFAAGSAHATNGYFTHGVGTKNKAMAGAGIALAEDSIDTVNNPAVANFIGEDMQLGISVFSPKRSYSTTTSDMAPPPGTPGTEARFIIGPNAIDSDSEYFLIPHFSRSWQQTDTRAFAVSFYGRGGMNTDWKGGSATYFVPQLGQVITTPGTFGAGDAGVDLSQAFLDLTWSWKINDSFSIGVAPMLAAQMFEATGVGTFAPFTRTCAEAGFGCFDGTVFPENLTNNGHEISYGYGAKVGVHFAGNNGVSFGISYQSKLKMTELDDYADLFAEQGGFDIPATLKAGIGWQLNDAWALAFDVEHTWFSDVDSVGNSIANIFACPTAPTMGPDVESCLGGDNGAGFGWDDMTTYKVGARFDAGNGWVWRFGYSHGDQPIPNTEMTFNILAPAVVEDHFTVGTTRSLESGNEWSLAFMYAPSKSQTGPQNFDPFFQTVTWEMDQFELEFSFNWIR